MKTLLIIRHAKTEVGFGKNDFDRLLTERGQNDAAMMAERIKAKKINVDALIASPANRAAMTAKLFSKAFNKNEGEIIFIEALYYAAVDVFYEVIQHIDDQLDTVVIFSHNPGVTNFVNTLTEVRVDHMPTCSVFAVNADIKSWGAFEPAKKNFLFFDYPKNVLSNQ